MLSLLPILAIFIASTLSAPTTTTKPCEYGPDTCIQGYVWREAYPTDHVCVKPDIRTQASRDNANASSRRQPGGGEFGPDTCRQGFVWREARGDDHVCVTPAVRSQVKVDNREKGKRRSCDIGVIVFVD